MTDARFEQWLERQVVRYTPDELEDGEPCDHDQTQLRSLTTSNGSVQLVMQCLACGMRVSNPVRHDRVHGNVPPFDLSLRERGRERREERRQERRDREKVQMRLEYQAYLQSDAWQERRRKVLARARGICEGCGERPATQVHHLTYDRVGSEMLFDLVAVCRECHETIHFGGEPAP